MSSRGHCVRAECFMESTEHARGLILKAENDLKSAEIGLEHNAPLDTVCFHLQPLELLPAPDAETVTTALRVQSTGSRAFDRVFIASCPPHEAQSSPEGRRRTTREHDSPATPRLAAWE